MKKKLSLFLLGLIAVICAALPLMGQPFTSLTAFQNQTDGTIIYAATWNATIGSLYTYITSTLLPQLNCVTQKGDMYVYTGSALNRLPVGSNGQVLTANSANTLGVNWTAGAGLPITTKGDIIVGNSSGVATRLPAGTNGYVLTSDSTQTNGVAYEQVVNLNPPSGAIIIWYQTYGGTVPSGWHLCDGTNGTPNLIGMVVIGGQYTSGSATSNPNGYGNTTEGTYYGGTTTSHSHTYSGTSSTPSSAVTAQAGTTVPVGAASSGMTVTYSGGTNAVTVSTQPAGIGLQYIMKL